MAYGDEQEQDFGMGGPGFGLGPDVRAGPDLAPGYDVSTGYAGGSTGGPEEAFNASDAIGSMADILDQAANAVQDFQTTGPAVQAGGTMGEGGVSMGADYSAMTQDPDPAAAMGGGPGGQIDAGSQPSLDQLSATMGIDPAHFREGGTQVGAGGPGDAAMGGGPQDVIQSQVAEEEVGAEEVATPGEETATFLSDFNRGMSAQSPEEVLTGKIDSLQDQAAELQAQSSGDPTMGGGPSTSMTAERAAAMAPAGGGEGWNNPNTFAGQLGMLSAKMDRQERELAGISAVQRGYPQPSLDIADYRGSAAQAAAAASGGGQGWVNPNASFEELEAQFSTSPQVSPQAGMWDNPNTAYSPLENPNYPAWQNPNTVRPPLEGANFPPDWYNVNEQRAYPTAMGGNLPPISAQEAAATATGGGQGWVDPNATFEELEAQFSTSPEQAATTLAPKYSEETTSYQTHDQMYPNHRNVAAMAGVASIKAQFDGTHKAWIDDINQDMKDRKIELDHEINGVKTGKHSSGNWKEYNDLFTVGEDGVPRDSNGVAMPGTERQAQSGMAGALQGLWGGILSGAEKFFQPSTSSGVVGADRPEPVRSEGDENRGDHPIDVMRSIYPWAASLPNTVLFNAAKYPDYLRLLIEADASGTELPLVVPEWILEGRENPNTNTNGNGNGNGTTGNVITNHPAMQTQQAPAGWGVPTW